MSEPKPHADTRPQPAAPSAGAEPTLNGGQRASGSAAVPPAKPAKKRWLDDESAAAPSPPPAKRDPTLELPEEERILDAESATPVDPWADVDPLPTAGAPYPLGLPPTRPYTAALPPTPAPAPPPPPAAPPAQAAQVSPGPVPAPVTRPPAAPPAVRPPRKVKADRRQKVAPPGWRPPPGYVAVPVRRRRKWPWVLLLTIALCCGLPAWIGDPMSRQWPANVPQLPTEVSDLTLREDRASRRIAEAAHEATAAAHPWETSFAGVYGDGTGKRVTVFGVVDFRWNPESDLADEFQRLVDTYGIGEIQTVDATERGEHRKCGVGTDRGTSVVVCTWADHGSLGTGVFTRRDIPDSNDLLSTIRDTIIIRG